MKRAAILALGLAACHAPGTSEEEDSPENYTQAIRGSQVEFEMVWVEDAQLWVGKHEVTWDEYLLYCDFEQDNDIPPDADAVTKPSKPLDWTPYDRDWGAGRRPAVGMSWNAAQKYCAWLSANTGVAYRLPTEEEWAAFAGPRPADAQSIAEQAWCAENSNERTQEVGQKSPNANGLHDVFGNLWEYCANPYSADDADQAVLRGGSWQQPAASIDPAARLAFDYDWTLRDPNYPPGVWWIPDGPHLGIRIVRDSPSTP